MNDATDNPYEALEKIFHEPNRLAIMSALCAADNGMAFGDLKVACSLTDGNLNRHLKVLQEAGAVEISKTFVKDKPRTTIYLSKAGLARFNEYLEALEKVLRNARDSLRPEARAKDAAGLAGAKAVRA